MLFADLYPFNPYSSGSDTSGIKMLIVKLRLNTQQKMDCEGNPPIDFQGTEETSQQINNETVEMRWQQIFEWRTMSIQHSSFKGNVQQRPQWISAT